MPLNRFFRVAYTFIFFLTIAFFFSISPQKIFAATYNCTTTASGTWNWTTIANWTTCNGSYPGASSSNTYNVAINSTVATTINLTGDINYIGIITIIGNGVAHTINFNGHTLTSSNTTTINAPTSNSVTNLISIDTGIFNAGGNITITAGTRSSRASEITLSTGTLNVNGNINYGGTAAGAQVLVSNTGLIIAQSVGANGLFSEAAATGTLELTGSSPVVQAGSNYTYNNIEFAGTGTATFTATKTINGNIIIDSGVVDFGGTATTIDGTTEIKNGATLEISSATGANTFIGGVTLDSGSTWDDSGNDAVSFENGLTNNGGTFNSGTGIQTFKTNAQSIGGTAGLTIANMTITSIVVTDTYTGSSVNLNVTTSLAGTGTLRESSGGYLLLSGSATITTLDLITNTPNTVEYNGTGAFTIKGTTYQYLLIDGSGGNGTLGGTTTINNTLTITGTTLTTGGNTITVTQGTTVINATLAISSTTGTKTFGDITLSSGSTMSFTAAEAIVMNGSLEVDDTSVISGTTGAWTFQDSSSGTIGGSANTTLTIASATFTGNYSVSIPVTTTSTIAVTGVTLTNDSTIIVGTNLTGTGGTLTQGTGSTLNIGGTSTIATLNSNATGNTVNYTGSSTQTIKVPSSSTYYNLTYSGSSTGTLGGDMIVSGNITISSGTLSSGSHILTLGGDFNNSGGAFTQGTGTVTFVDPTQTSHIIGTTTFYKFISTIPNKNFIFTHGDTTTVSNTLTLNGQSCESPTTLSSDSSGNPFTLTAPVGTNAQYLSVKDSTSTNSLTASDSVSVSGNSGWTITPDACAGQTTAYSFQRKTFYDSTNGVYWRFSYDGTQIKGEYNISPWNSGWTTSSSIATSTNDFSLWKDSSYVFIAYVSGNSIVVRRGTLSPTSISWGSTNTALNGTSASDTYIYPNISEDSSGYLWVSATYNNSSSSLSYSVVTIVSSSTQDPTSWASANSMSNTNSTNADIYGVTVSLGSQNMLTVYEVNGTIYSQLYTNGSGYGSAVSVMATANTGIDKNFSISTDTNNNAHMVVIDTSGFVQYYKYTGSWSGATRLDNSATNQYPSVAIDKLTNDVYVIYYRSSRINYKQYHSGTWGSETNTTWTTDSTSMNLSLNYSDSGYIYGVWQTGSGTYAINFNNILLPNGFLSLNTPSSATLSSVNVAAILQNSTGSTGTITITNTEGTGVTWSLTATSTDFTGGGHTIVVTNFTINPSNSTLVAVVGDPTLTGLSTGIQHTFTGTNDPVNIVTAATGYGQGQYTINPTLSLNIPIGVYWGNYTATLTLTAQ